MRHVLPLALALAAATAFAQTPAPAADPAPAPAAAPAVVDNPVLVNVNGDEVRAGELRLMMQNIASRVAQSGQEPDQERVENAAMRQAIDLRLLCQEAARQEVVVPDAAVAGILDRIISQNGGREALAATLAANGIELADVRQNIAGSETVRALVETKIKPGITVSDEDLNAFYAANPAEFERPAQAHARHILLTVAPDATAEAKEAARAAAAAARDRVLAGEDFAAVAKAVSQCPSAESGGDLGDFTQDMMVKPFSEAAFALTPGAVSEVVETDFGYHVIKLEDKQDAGKVELTEVKERLREHLVDQQVGAAMDTLLESLRASAKVVTIGGENDPFAATAPAAAPEAAAPSSPDAG